MWRNSEVRVAVALEEETRPPLSPAPVTTPGPVRIRGRRCEAGIGHIVNYLRQGMSAIDTARASLTSP